MCENSLGGLGLAALLAWYSALVRGWINGPALAMMARRPAPKSAWASAMLGCSAKLRVLLAVEPVMDAVKFGAMFNTPPKAAGEAAAAAPSGAVPAARSAIGSGSWVRTVL